MALPNPGWNVVYGEIPAASKWTQLGANDDALAAGTGLNDLAIATAKLADGAVTGAKIASYKNLRQSDTTNSTETAAVLQSGWGVLSYPASPNVTEAITFPAAFTNRPIVVLTFGGDAPASTTYGAGGNLVEGIVVAKAHTITNTGFTVQMHKPNGTNFAAGFGFYQWIAIGV